MSETDGSGRTLRVEAPDGDFEAYLAAPASGSGSGVLVIQEWWGLVPQIRRVCDRLARRGFVALAPDLYRGAETTDPDEAGRMMMNLEIPRAGRDLGAAAETLRRRPEVEGAKLGCIGFCMGGQLALFAATLRPEIGAVVDCYGLHPQVHPDWTECRAKVLGVFAEHDEYISADAVESLDRELAVAGVKHHLETYSGVQHAFLNDDRPDVYDARVAARAWQDIENFLEAELG